MSQKVRIIKVRHAGASVYLGDDSCRNHCWTRNPERIMDWLCDGWRTRFNQHREHRTIRRYMEDMESHCVLASWRPLCERCFSAV